MQAVVHSRARRPSPVVLSLLMRVGVLLRKGVAKPKAAKPAVVIQMMDMPASFQPEQKIIRVGDTVEWKNVGMQLHHVTTDPAAALKRSDVSTPAGANPF